eukprot:scaffold18323_cov59-Phaeocystis_antarctica.AAC.2
MRPAAARRAAAVAGPGWAEAEARLARLGTECGARRGRARRRPGAASTQGRRGHRALCVRRVPSARRRGGSCELPAAVRGRCDPPRAASPGGAWAAAAVRGCQYGSSSSSARSGRRAAARAPAARPHASSPRQSPRVAGRVPVASRSERPSGL